MISPSRIWITLILACGLAAPAVADTQVGDAVIATQSGPCKVRLNEADIGCPKGAIYSRLGNGRHLVNFVANDIASVGFAGQKLETTGQGTSVLWLDGAYINQQRVEADGQCAFERKAQGNVELSCRAILRDGRKLSATLKAREQTDTFMGVARADSRIDTCEQIVTVYGVIGRAQLQCNFHHDTSSWIDDVRKCAPILGEDRVKELMRQGMELFDSREKQTGRATQCEMVKRMPGGTER
ncbi:MAG: hypothetical protein AB1586_01080 [Pseudomonadota bacterium]